MPKRTTTTYSSEDNPDQDAPIYVYYCRYSGEHAFITDAAIEKLPQRKTDGARVLDTQQHHVKLRVTPGSVKYIKRGDGKVEKQFRYNCGEVPILYKSEQHGRYIYVMDKSVTAFTAEGTQVVPGAVTVGTGGASGSGGGGGGGGGGGEAREVMVPPCISATPTGTQIGMDIEDGAPRLGLIHINADEVGLEVMASAIKVQDFMDEVREYMGKVLKLRMTEMRLDKGWSARTRLLHCNGITPNQAYDRLQVALDASRKKAIKEAMHGEKLERVKGASATLPTMGLQFQ